MSSSNTLNLGQPEILSFDYGLTLYHTIPTFNDPIKKPFENIVGKGEKASNQHFLLLHNVFYPSQKEFLFLSYYTFILSSENAFNLDQSEKLMFGQELNWVQDVIYAIQQFT